MSGKRHLLGGIDPVPNQPAPVVSQ